MTVGELLPKGIHCDGGALAEDPVVGLPANLLDAINYPANLEELKS
jgi:hypothetical protein